MVCRPTLHQTNRSKLHVAYCDPDRDPLSLLTRPHLVTDHPFYDTCHVICRMRAHVVVLHGVRRHMSGVHGVRHASRCIVACRRHAASCTLYACAPRPCCDIVHDVTTEYILLQRTVAVRYTVLQCSAPCCTLHTSSAMKPTVPSQTLLRAIQPRPVRPAAHLWSPARTRHAPYNMQHALDNMQPACNLHATFSTQQTFG